MPIEQRKHYAGHRARVRERFLDEPHKMADYELLELQLGHVLRRKDTKPLAKELLQRFGNIAGVLEAGELELLDVPGVGPALVAFLAQVRQMAARYYEQPLLVTSQQKEQRNLTLDDIGKLARSRLAGCPREEVWAALLDNSNRLLKFIKVSTGSVDCVLFSEREILKIALGHNATGMVLVHNHPGGTKLPSTPDIESTKKVAAALSGAGIRLFDHLILANGNYHSLTRDHLLD